MEVQNYTVLPAQNQLQVLIRYAVADPMNGTQIQNANVYLTRGTEISAGPIADTDVIAAVQAKINAAGKVAPVTVTIVAAPVPQPDPIAQAVLQPLAAKV